MRRSWICACVLLLIACGLEAEDTYGVTGIVHEVDAAHLQLQIEHDDIAGFMPAMTMNFDVASKELMQGIEPGMHVKFELERSATSLRITAIEVLHEHGRASVSAGPEQFPLDVAPDFELIDHRGNRFSLSDLRGSAVLLDFVFTRCKGPCPILTAAHAELQLRLPPAIARRTHLVSVSIDPIYDTPKRLRAYGEARGANLERWSFLTGSTEAVQKVLTDYHIGTTREQNGTLAHVVVTFLIDPEGRIARRYIGLEHPPEKILADLEEILS
ncbi:MAG: redoxin domain-containing protein [Deltaproteobacteria bacterium]|nr:SCO family protein [Deltaproteobacteria bacterium]MCZ6823258.1 SCO family protein [Deltaproteobacteria bacterium]TDI96666.1 MAG: redoxin domain-containing protein [Deltaproteobacteria bacterium]TDJ06123.1 MAG: redoxin domain-containing protein [Deltaproteobacteria bacterium]